MPPADGHAAGDARPVVPSASPPLERVLLELAVGFVNVPIADLDDAIDRTLRTIGELTGVGRTYLFTYDWGSWTCSNTHEWCAAGVPPVIDELQDVDLDLNPDWVARHRQGLEVYIPTTRDPSIPEPQRRMWAEQGVSAIVGVPLMVEGTCAGFVGADAVDGPRVWSPRDRELLHVLAELLAQAMQRRSSERVRLAAEELAVRNEHLASLAGVLAHDLKTPLVSIHGMLSLLRGGRLEGGQQDLLLDRAVAAADRLAGMIDRLLAYAAAGREIADPSPVALSDVVVDALERLEGVLDGRAVDLDVGPLPVVMGDHHRLVDVLQNLLGNAVVHAPPGRRTRVTVRGHSAGETVTLTVADDGEGIAPQDRQRVLGAFERGGDRAGAGLGLAICTRVVAAHGGTLALSENASGGLTVTVLLPAVADVHT